MRIAVLLVGGLGGHAGARLPTWPRAADSVRSGDRPVASAPCAVDRVLVGFVAVSGGRPAPARRLWWRDDGGGGSGGGAETVTATDGKVTIEARDVKFDVKTINATPGDLEITLVEKGNLEHTLVVEDADGRRSAGNSP